MPLFYFVLKHGCNRVPEPEGVELPGETAARSYAMAVARDLMRHRTETTRSWRLEVCDDYLIPLFEILFADVNDTIDHLAPEYRRTIGLVSQSAASLYDAITCVQSSIDLVKETLARVDAVVATSSVYPPQLHQPSSY